MNKTVIKTLIAAWASMCAVGVHGADSISVKSPIVNRIGVDLRSGWAPPTNSYIRGENHLRQSITTTSAIHFRYDMSFTDATRWGRLFPGAYQGIGIGINTFYKKDLLGCPTSLYVYQGAPIVHFSRRLWLGYEWNFGASFGWKKYDKDENEQNLVIGSSVNAYINVSFLLHYRLTSRWQLVGGVEGAHYSNGNTSWPNAGVNSVGARIGVSYLMGGGNDSYSKNKPVSDEELEQYDAPAWNYDVVAYGAVRKRV
ncbi:MAG: acyloxyacyl hydrolase, partial [Muribaculaceae bacterium]|nr:acyloxyacyl hydrolase [Muribaculaceae bacterium]